MVAEVGEVVSYRQRFCVLGGPGSLAEPRRERDFGLVVRAPNQPDEVEAALAYLAFVPKAICVEWPDVVHLSRQGRSRGDGLAHVVDQVFDVEKPAIAARDDLLARGFGSAFLLLQLVAARDWKSYSLPALEALDLSLFGGLGCPSLFTVGHDYWRSRTVLIGFERRGG